MKKTARMPRLHATLLALIFLSPVAFAQPAAKTEDRLKVKARIGEKHKPDPSMMPYRIVRGSPSTYIVLRSPDFDTKAFTKQSPRLDAYDRAKLTYERSLELVLERRGKERLLLEDLVVMDRKPTLIARTAGQEEVALYYQHIDPNLTRQPPAFDRLCAFPVEAKERQALYAKAGNATRDKWSTVIAPDSSHLLIHSPEMRGSNDGQPFYLLAAVDKQMNVKWQHILRMDGDGQNEVLSAAIDGRGTAYLVIKRRKSETSDGADVALHRINADELSRLPFGMDEGYSPTGGILQHVGQRLAYAGIYANGGRKLGNFIAWIDSIEAGARGIELLPFAEGTDLEAEEAIGVDESKQEAKTGKKEQKRLRSATDVVALFPRGNGGYYIVNEIAFSAVHTDAETAKRFQRFYRGPVLARCVGKEGQVTWSTWFKRWAVTDEPIIGRALPVVFKDQLHLFLWDNENVAELRKTGGRIAPKTSSGNYTVYAYFDEKGLHRTKPVLRSDNDKALIAGWELTPVGPDEYAAFGTNSMIELEYLPVRLDFIQETKK
ncbi:MAG: hypothetical protein IPJ85_08675 [Flavobacteriales bacterium]|nr:hypothetical protein [Flavobacteriales bacterium]